MINIKRKEDCVGCNACEDACAHGAISFINDIEGFWYPVVDKDRCVECGLCEKICPVLQAENLNHTNDGEIPLVYAAYNTNPEVRFVSTTGGLYSALAEKMLEQGGYIGGAVWTDDFQAKQIISNKPEDLLRLRGSKYFQSDSTGLYKEIRKQLKAGEKVLICGCPCQMAALRSFLRKDYDNLFIVDFICCSINSPKLFQSYVYSLEEQYGSKMVSYHPKNKEYGGWHKFAFKATFANGEVYAKNGIEDDFTNCFIGTHLAARPSCFNCRFKLIPRVADITIADFWGIENVDKDMDSPNGTSLVILNNEKGRNYFASLGDKVFTLEKTLGEAAVGNIHIYKSLVKSNVDRQMFYRLVDEKGFKYAMDKMGRAKSRSIFKRIAHNLIKKVIGRKPLYMKPGYEVTIKLNNGVDIPIVSIGPAALGYTPKYRLEQNSSITQLYRKVLNRLYYSKHSRNYVDAVAHSFQVGFKLLDYSSSYGDGSLIGKAIKKSGVDRKDLFLTTRISNIAQRDGRVKECLMQQLSAMDTDYVDLLMFHWPVTGYYLETWKQMVELYKAGYCRTLGVANCNQHHLEELSKISDIIPAVNQIEVHPLFTQKKLIEYCKEHSIQVEAYTAIARMDDRLVRLPLLKKIAKKYNKTIVQVVLRWHIQNGVIPVVRSLNKKRQLENISIFDFELTLEEMSAIDGININSRLRYDPDNCDFSIL